MKQFMKKILIPLLVLSMCFSMTTVFSAEEALVIERELDIEAGTLIVKGTLQSSKGSVPMTMILKKDGMPINVGQMTTGQPVDGVIDFRFEPIPFPNNTTSGNYTVYVSAEFVNVYKEDSFIHYGPEKRLAAMEDLQAGVTGNSPDAVRKAISENLDVLGLSAADFQALSSDAQTVLAELIIDGGDYTLPDGSTSDEQIDAITAAVQKLTAVYKESYPIAKAVDVADDAALEAFLKDYGELLGFTADDPNTAYDELVLAGYLEELEKTDDFYDRINALAKTAADGFELRDGILRIGVLELVEASRYTKIQEIVEKLPQLFTVNTTDLEKLSDSKKAQAYQAVSGREYKSVEAFVTALDDEVESLLDDGGSGGSSGGGSGGGGSRGSSSAGQFITVDPAVNSMPDPSDTAEAYFRDMEGFEWADEAVTVLYENKIVSGKAQHVFDPSADVTRAEFVKMLVISLGLSVNTDYNDEFLDVYADDWYAPYVSAAKAQGIAEGSGGYFSPSSKITREDMAVMLFRAKKMTASENEKDIFYDSDEMSDYAKPSIFVLYEQGIMKGKGNGIFAPKASANRAEAAQVIYNAFLKK